MSFPRDSSGNYIPDADVNDRLTRSGAGWRYFDSSSRSEEAYDAQGVLTNVAFAEGGSLSHTYSDASTPAAVALTTGLLIAVQDHVGRSVRFEYEQPSTGGSPRIVRTIDPAGQTIVAAYDTAGNLSQLNWADGKKRQYLYERTDLPWALTGIVDENNSRLSTYGYDPQGRAASTEGAGGVNRFTASYGGTPPGWYIALSYDPLFGVVWRDHYWQLPQSPVMGLPDGSAVNFTASLILGLPRVTSRTQPAGSGCAASQSFTAYDANGNVASADNFNGKRTCRVSDLGRNLEATRVEGLANTQSCSSVTSANALLPADGRKVSTRWHPDWRLPTTVAYPGKLTTSVFNGQPDPFNGNALASCAPAGTVLPDGKPIAVLCKQVEQATLDANGAKGFDVAGVPATAPDSSFNNIGLLLHMDGSSGATSFVDSSSHAYQPSHVVNLTTDAANARFGSASGNFTGGYLWYAASPDFDMGGGNFTVETWAKFNSASSGQRVYLLSQSESNGANWTFYISKGTGNTLGAGINTDAGAFSLAGTAAIVPNTWYHLALVRSGSTLSPWRNGVLEASTSVSGTIPTRTTHLGIGVVGEYAPGSGGAYGGAYGTAMMGWLDDLRITKGVARYTGPFTVPSAPFGDSVNGASAVPSSMDASVPARQWSYTYNQYGQVLTAKGPRTDVNDTTTYTYYTDTTVDHTIGDPQSVTNALGKVTQYPKYNKYGQVLRMIDPNGVTTDTTYDLRQRVAGVSVGGQTTTYTYDAAGQLTRVTQPDTSYVGYSYDDAHRLTAVFDNLNNRIEYTLDNAGNRVAENIKDPANVLARQLTRVMDALGRVQQTTGRQ